MYIVYLKKTSYLTICILYVYSVHMTHTHTHTQTFIIYVHFADKTHAPPIRTCIGFSLYIYALSMDIQTHTTLSSRLHSSSSSTISDDTTTCSFIQIVCFQKEYPPSHTFLQTKQQVRYFLLQLSQT